MDGVTPMCMDHAAIRIGGVVVLLVALALLFTGDLPVLWFWLVMLAGFVVAALLNRADGDGSE